MESPKSRQHKEKRLSYRRREHKNKKFYNSKAWRDTRESYLKAYQHYLFTYIPLGRWDDMELTEKQQSYLLSLSYLPCETCLRLYCAEAYDKVNEGKELDHKRPVNPANALKDKYTQTTHHQNGQTITESYRTHGDPFDFKNLQLLCRFHHAKKSQRER